MDWDLEIGIHWPHHRFAIGWDIIHADEKYNYETYNLYLAIFTLTLNIYN